MSKDANKLAAAADGFEAVGSLIGLLKPIVSLVMRNYHVAAKGFQRICEALLEANASLTGWINDFRDFDVNHPDSKARFAQLAKRYGETSKEVLHAIVGHHDDITIDHPYTVLVAAADAISASRPGARRETLEKYVKRLEELEAVACGFPGVEQAFAIQAGRELRVIANSHRMTDAEAQKAAHDIARAIEQQLDYPGEIKVTVVREIRASATAG